MDSQNIFKQFFRAVFHELFRSKTGYNIIASVILLSVVAIGYCRSESYVSNAAITLEQRSVQNSSSADLDRIVRVYDTYSFQQQITKTLASQLPSELQSSAARVDYFKDHSSLSLTSNKVIRISFSSSSPSRSQAALVLVVDELLSKVQPQTNSQDLVDIYASLREEEQNLIRDLELNDEEIKAATTYSGNKNRQRSQDRIGSITEALQDVEVNLSALNAKISGILRRLDAEEAFHSSAERLKLLNTQKEKLSAALTENNSIYSANSPEVISLQQELDNVNIEIVSLTEKQPMASKKSRVSDALYEQLRQQLTLEEIEKESLTSRESSLERILLAETKKANDDEAYSAALSQLQNEAEVLGEKLEGVVQAIDGNLKQQRNIREAFGQYVVLDEPTLPQTYSGFGFIEFLILGPILSFGLPFGAASLLVLSDSRIRTSRQLKNIMPPNLSVLSVIPHYNSPKTLRIFRKALLGLVMWGIFVFIVYFTVGVIGLKG